MEYAFKLWFECRSSSQGFELKKFEWIFKKTRSLNLIKFVSKSRTSAQTLIF